MTSEFEAAAKQWQDDGYVVFEGLVPEADIDAARHDLEKLYGADTFADYNRVQKLWEENKDVQGKAFRPHQFDGMRGFPFGGNGGLNDLFVNASLIGFAKAAMQSDDIRIYQAAVWHKTAGEVNYEQPLHRDGNHSLVPPRIEPGFWHMECFLFLSDVDEDCAPPRLVPKSKSDVLEYDQMYEHEIAATGKRGSLMAYSSDVWHRGTDFGRPDASRTVMVIAFKLGGAEWIGYDAFPRSGQDKYFSKFVAGKTPDDLALFGVPRPGNPFWNAATIDEMERRHPGLDMTPWREGL